MNLTHHLVTTAVMIALVGCASTEKPASDLSGAGFVLETPNAEMRAAMIKLDRPFAEQVAVNREACLRAPLCWK